MVYNTTLFDIPPLTNYLHGLGLQLGLYNQPGIPCEAANKTIYGTNISVGSTFSGVENVNSYCYYVYDNAGTQLYHNTLIDHWASWGVGMIKLDYVTPGSSTRNQGYPSNTSASAIAFHQAITNNGRSIRLDLSSNVCRDEPYLGIWTANAESIGLAVDINSYGASVFVGMWRIQQTIEQ
jgi:alpha-galactosidase